MKTLFGWIGFFISTVYKLPQMLLLYREKKHEGLSIVSLSAQALSYVFYILHGFFIDDTPVYCMGIIGSVQTLILIVMYFAYNTKDPPRDKPTDL